MEPPRQKWIARLVLLAGAAAGLICLIHLGTGPRISTDILDLVPTDERSAELSLVRSLAGEDQARVLLLALRVPARPGEPAEDRARRADRAGAGLADALAAAPAVAQALPLSDARYRDALAGAVYAQRFDLLLPGWLAQRAREFEAAGSQATWSAWLAERSASDLEAYLSRPEAMAAQDILTSDPLLLVPSLADRMGGLTESGLVGGRAGDFALVWARSR
ncbi:MAG TPA: hypothetical protein VKG78_00655, partial [Opitutaceae bacterium]|nr:hypothetical protein [Opitutaceae bacterium]